MSSRKNNGNGWKNLKNRKRINSLRHYPNNPPKISKPKETINEFLLRGGIIEKLPPLTIEGIPLEDPISKKLFFHPIKKLNLPKRFSFYPL